MKPTRTVAEFIRRGREAGQDALGVAHDPEAIMSMAAMHRETFLRDRSERALRRWRELVAEIAASGTEEPALQRWLGIEHVRLGRAFKSTALEDGSLFAEAKHWIARLDAVDRDDVMSRFDLDLMVSLRAVTADRRG